MTRFSRFLGIALGGGRGKTTAVAELGITPSGAVQVRSVALRAPPDRPWTDDALIERIGLASGDVVVAIDAPLTTTACGRCVRPVCPGMEPCIDPAVMWLRNEGRRMAPQVRIAPWAHRGTDLEITHRRELLPLTTLGHVHGSIAARAIHLRKRLGMAGFVLHRDLVEVAPAATIAALCGDHAARGYKRDADPWSTRAMILAQLGDLSFAPQSRMAREEVLQNDHGFDAVIAAYTASRFAREGWTVPDGTFADDGWIFAPAKPAPDTRP